MRCFKSMVALLLVALCLNAKAGVTAITYHSRANCVGFNESISWRLGTSYWFQTYSQHFKNISDAVPNHMLDTGAASTWRSAAYHATEGYGGWFVKGWHYFYDGRDWVLIMTQATDCSIYDGWWDH